MSDILSIDYGSIVKVYDELYWVDGVDCESRTARLVPVDLLDEYANDETALTEHSNVFPERVIRKLNPVHADENVLRSLFRLETTTWELAKRGLYPFGSVTGKFHVNEEDVLVLIDRLREKPVMPLLDGWRDNFIYNPERPCHADYPKYDSPVFPLGYLCDKVVNAIDFWDLDEDDINTLLELRDAYLRSKGKPVSETVIPEEFRGDLLANIEAYAKTHTVTDDIRAYYVKLLDELSYSGFEDDIRRKAYAYYGGNDVVPCSWRESEEALLRLYELTGDRYAANSLGYIYGSDRLGAPDYDKAFYYFNEAAGAGVLEAQYKLSDLYRKGRGTEKDPEKAWQIISELYEKSDKKHKDQRKFPDIALRMGYCYRDGIGTDKDDAKALSCFMEAKEGIELRIRYHKGFGDETVLKNVLAAIESVNKS